ncbi:MAG: hypothetical protein Q8Q47_12055, partial [Ignavibacteriaceae bacterium]|nr:hypothetical protein [Ignavibacteriaceae bacterium]
FRIPEAEDGLYALYGEITVTENIPSITLREPTEIPGTNSNSINPSIAVLESGSNHIYHLAYEESNAIRYAKLQRSSNQYVSVDLLTSNTLSTGSGHLYNRYPSLIVMNDNYARVTWQGTRYEEEQRMDLRKVKKGEDQNSSEGTERTRIVFKSSDFNYFWSFGNNTGKPNINRHSTAYAVAWSENNGSSVSSSL